MGTFKGNFKMPTVLSARTKEIIRNAMVLNGHADPMVCPERPEKVITHATPSLHTARQVKKVLFQNDHLLDFENAELYEEKTPFFKVQYDVKEFNLALPTPLIKLKILFEGLEAIFKLTTEVKTFVTMEALKSPLNKLLEREVSLSEIGRIVYLYPDAYDIEISLDSGDVLMRQNLRNDTRTDVELQQRKTTFTQLLYAWAHKCHKVFLTCQIPPIYVDTTTITAWHPFFDLTKVNVPVAKYFAAIDPTVLTDKQLEAAMDFFHNHSLTFTSGKLCQLKTNQQRLMLELTKTLKQREAEKRLADMKGMLKDIRFIYIVEKKNILSFKFIVDRVYYMYNGCKTQSVIAEILDNLTEKASDVIQKQVVGNVAYARFNLEVNLNEYTVQF